MSDTSGNDIVRCEVEVNTEVDPAFRTFIERFNDWWPRIYTFAGDNLDVIAIEPFYGGRCLERDKSGEELIWGHVIEWEPPEVVAFSWWITPDRTVNPDLDRASEVEVRFESVDGRTRVALEHRHLSRHEGDWQAMQSAMGSEQGWPMLLQNFAELAEQ